MRHIIFIAISLLGWLFIFNTVVMKRDVLNTIISTGTSSGAIVNPDVDKMIYYGGSTANRNFTPAMIKALGNHIERSDRFGVINNLVLANEYLVIAIPTEYASDGKFLYNSFQYNITMLQRLMITDEHGNDYDFDIFVFKYPYGTVANPATINNLEIL